MTKKVLVTGACLRPDGFELGEGKYYGEAKLYALDLENGTYDQVLSMSGGGENYPAEHPNQQYTAACMEGDILWLPTDTEIHKYQLPDFELLSTFSHPCFHNIHSVHVFDDKLVATSTGLDNVVVMDKSTGEILEIINTEGKDPWHRFDAATDYRLVHSTRPHDSHPNFVFKLNDELWVTRCTQEDAVCLSDVSQRIDISENDTISVHDGIVVGDQVFFTRVDGFIAICDVKSRKLIKNLDPFENEKNRPLGWCRGLLVDGDVFYIGYSKLRKTKLLSKLSYLKNGNLKYMSGNNSLVVAYNYKEHKVLGVYESQDGELDAIYSILPFSS